MQTDIQEIYKVNIFPLADSDQLKLATLILENVTRGGTGATKNGTKRSIRELFGKGRSVDPNGADNETIDADLARAYLDTHED